MAGKKMKFDPEIKEVVLNPEQAVLACPCYEGGTRWLHGAASKTGKFTGFGFFYWRHCWGRGHANEPACVSTWKGWTSHKLVFGGAGS